MIASGESNAQYFARRAAEEAEAARNAAVPAMRDRHATLAEQYAELARRFGNPRR